MVLGCAAVQASMVIIDYQGETVVRPQSVERNLIINSDDGGVYNIAVRPLEDAVKIPVAAVAPANVASICQLKNSSMLIASVSFLVFLLQKAVFGLYCPISALLHIFFTRD